MADEEPGDRESEADDGWGAADDSDEWGAGDDGSDDEREWRFSVDEVGPDDEEPDAAEGETKDDEGGNVAGSITPAAAVESGTPDFENVVFVALGVLFTVLVFAGVVTPLTPRTVAIVTAAVGGLAGATYLLFRRF